MTIMFIVIVITIHKESFTTLLGLFEDDFIEERRKGLEDFINK